MRLPMSLAASTISARRCDTDTASSSLTGTAASQNALTGPDASCIMSCRSAWKCAKPMGCQQGMTCFPWYKYSAKWHKTSCPFRNGTLLSPNSFDPNLGKSHEARSRDALSSSHRCRNVTMCPTNRGGITSRISSHCHALRLLWKWLVGCSGPEEWFIEWRGCCTVDVRVLNDDTWIHHCHR